MDKKESLIFCQRSNGRIGVFLKMLNVLKVEDVLRIGTIRKIRINEKYAFIPETLWYGYFTYESDSLIDISKKLKSLNKE